jgi:HMG box factor
MTLSMPDPSSAWDRTLPKPDAILQSLSEGTFARRGSSLLQHHLVTRSLSQDILEGDLGRRSTVPCISYHERRPSVVNGGRTRMINSIPYDPSLLPPPVLGPLTRKRNASDMAEESLTGSKSPTSPIAGEGVKEFCLCQPDPKIPRPRNGECCFAKFFSRASSDCRGGSVLRCSQLTIVQISLHLVSTTSTGRSCRTTSRATESGDIKDYW